MHLRIFDAVLVLFHGSRRRRGQNCRNEVMECSLGEVGFSARQRALRPVEPLIIAQDKSSQVRVYVADRSRVKIRSRPSLKESVLTKSSVIILK